MSATDVIALLDAAAPFVDVVENPAAIAAAVRRFGLAELDPAIAAVRAAEGEARGVQLQAACERLGQLVSAEALNEAFVKAALEEAASACGLIRDDGLKAVRKIINAGVKLGKKQPRDLAELRRHAAQEPSRPRIAATSGDDRAADIIVFPGDQPPPDAPVALSSATAAPAPPAEGNEDASSQMGVKPKAAAAWGAGGSARAAGADATASANGANSVKPPDASESDGERNMRLAFFPLTDLGNAERFRERWRGRLLFNTALATSSPGRQRGWLAWDNKRWLAESGAERVMIAEHETVRAIQDEAEALRGSGDRDAVDASREARDFVVEAKKDGDKVFYSDKVAKWGRTSESAQKLGALSKRGAPYLSVGIGQLDADRMKINVNNGTLSVRRRDEGDYVRFGAHDPADLITKIVPVDYDPEAAAPEFEKFLNRVQPKPEMRLFLQQWFGLSLTGDTSAHKLVFLYGKGRNGKSVLVNAVSHVAGDYAQSVPIETFLDQGKTRGGGQATPDLAKLPGVRLLRTSEPEKNARLAEALIKLVTGGEPMDARHLQGDFFTFFPEFKLTIQGNYKPVLSGTDEGIKSRLLLVPFDVTIPKAERDVKLADKLRAEASGILNWMLDGLRSWLDNGLTEPEEVTTATAKYFATADVLGRFLETCTMREPGHRVQSSVLHQVYEAWCKSAGETPWKNRGFSLAMDERGYERKQSDVVWWLDIKLTRTVNDFVDAQGQPIRVMDGEKGDEVSDIEL
jgi:putative DNA primase/helicase